MAVTHNVSGSSNTNLGTSILFNVTVVAGNDIAACIGISWVFDPLGPTPAITGVAVNGVEATFIQTVISVVGITAQFYITGLTAGVNTVTVAFDNPCVAVAGIEVMNDVDASDPIGSTATNSGNSTNVNSTVTGCTVDSMVVDSVVTQQNTAATLTVDGSQTQRWNSILGTAPLRQRSAGSTEAYSGASILMSWVLSAARRWNSASVEFLFKIPAPPVTDVNVRTSYDYLEVSPDKLDKADVLPEIAQRVWAGNWRGE